MHEGGRSNLFFEFARIVESLRPRWVLVENVPGLLSSNGGRDFGTVLGTLADVGYGVAWRVLDSRFFGVPQRRRRVFIVGTLFDGDPRAAAERAGQVLAVGTRCPGHPATRGEARPDVAVASLSGLGTGGPDDNDGYTGRVLAVDGAGRDVEVSPSLDTRAKDGPRRNQENALMIVNALRARDSKGFSGDPGEGLVAAPLSHGSNPNSNMAGRRREDDENLVIAGPLGGGNDGIGRRSEDDPNLVAAFSENQRAEVLETPIARQLTSGGGKPGQGYSAVRQDASVRRLMPVECERLQGLPDGWTDLGGTADSKRYAALGDAVTVTVAEWIGERLVAEMSR